MKRSLLCVALLLAALLLAPRASFAQQNVPTISGAVLAVNVVGFGTTGSVIANLSSVPGKVAYICGFDVSAAGSATISPIQITGLSGSVSFTYEGISAGTLPFSKSFYPCLPAVAPNGTISVLTTADATATAVVVNVWGFLQ